jgi:hypothetical protein
MNLHPIRERRFQLPLKIEWPRRTKNADVLDLSVRLLLDSIGGF